MQQMKMATKQQKEEQGEKIKVDDMEVKVKTLPPPLKVRTVYYCQICDTSFLSQLD
jgi:hypothetical protein